MKLKFCAKNDLLVPVPGTTQYAGQTARFVNRETSVSVVDGQEVVSWPAVETPFEVEQNSDDGRRLSKIATRDGDLLPYDKATAEALGIGFAPIKFSSGAWVPAPVSATKKGDS